MRRLIAPSLLLLTLLPTASFAQGFPTAVFPPANHLEEEFRKARALEEAGDPTAVDRYRSLLRQDFPLPDAVHWCLGRLLPPEEAEAHWRAVIEAEPRSPFFVDALQALADYSVAQGRLSEAQEWLERLLPADPDRPSRARTLGQLLALMEVRDRQDEAKRIARTLWVEYPSLPDAQRADAYLARFDLDPFAIWPPKDGLKRALNLLERGSREEAVRTLSELRRRLPPENPLRFDIAAALGKALYFLRRYEKALDPLSEAARDPRFAEEARFWKARCLFGLDRGDEGAKAMVDLAADYPDSSKAPTYLYQASRVFAARGMEDEARTALDRLRAKYPKAGEVRETLWSEGWDDFEKGQYQDAAARFSTAAEGARRGWLRARCLYWKGRALLKAGREQEGRGVLEDVIGEFPLGYYARLAQAELGGRAWSPIKDPRKVELQPIPVIPPGREDLRQSGELAVAVGYLRLGLTDAAATILRSVEGRDTRVARLLYWAGDFGGALSCVRRTWLDWPRAEKPRPLSREGLAFPLAYPKAATEAAREAGIDPHLVLAIAHTESHFDPRAYSWAEARGLMQFIPSTGLRAARAAGLGSFTVDDLYDPGISLRLGARHLRELLDRFDGNVVYAVAAYNGGSTAVDQWRKEFGPVDLSVFVESIPYRETRRYVKKVLTALDAYGRLDPPGLWPASNPTAGSARGDSRDLEGGEIGGLDASADAPSR